MHVRTCLILFQMYLTVCIMHDAFKSESIICFDLDWNCVYNKVIIEKPGNRFHRKGWNPRIIRKENLFLFYFFITLNKIFIDNYHIDNVGSTFWVRIFTWLQRFDYWTYMFLFLLTFNFCPSERVKEPSFFALSCCDTYLHLKFLICRFCECQ